MSYLIQYLHLETSQVIFEEKVHSSAQVPQKGCTLHIGTNTYTINDVDYFINQLPTAEHHGSYAIVYLTPVQ